MNPTQGQQAQQPIAFTDAHNAVYNGLRDTLMRYMAQGVPGIDKVVDALNKQHQQGMVNYQPTPARPMAATQMSQRPQQPANSSQMQRQQAGNLNDLMGQIRQQNAPSLPNGFSGYSG